MENPVWERILVDWVNCLKLSKPIHKIIDLKDGIFFSNLQKVIKKTSEIEFDVLTCLFDILNRHYPSFEIVDKSNVHLSDLPCADIVAITSLLMHYTCIYDRRDVLTSPLCHSLQPVTQLGIKTFLEKVQECPKLTSEDLSKIVLACLEDKHDANTSRPQDWLSVAQSPSNLKQSPLFDIFKTPVSKISRLQEKEREIARLITDLELGQEEKENLEEDLRLQKEKYRKLEKQLKQKNIEISRLKSEVLTLENRTPPHYQDKDFREAQKILRTKIEALEQIIEQCDNENEELRNERDAEKQQVKALESQCKTWLEKFIETDNKFQSLSQNAEEYEMKFKSLQAHCSELESLLDELRPKNHNDSFIEDSFQGVNINRRSRTFETLQSCEDLAHSVVDLQLKDMQKENESLRLSLEDLKRSCKRLEDNIEKITVDRNNISDINNKLDEDLKIALEKIRQLSSVEEKYECIVIEKEKLFEEYKTCVDQLEDRQKDNENLRQTLDNMEKNLEQLKESIDKLTVERNDISTELKVSTDELEQLSLDNKKLSNEYQDLLNEYGSLVHEKTLLSEQYDSCVAQLKDNQKENETLRTSLRHTESSLIHSEEIVKNLTLETNNILKNKNVVEEKLYVLTEKIQELTADNEKLMNMYQEEENKLSSLLKEKTHISEEYDRCIVQIENMQKETDKLSTLLEDTNRSCMELKEGNKNLADERNNILQDKHRLCENLSELRSKYVDLEMKYETVVGERNKFFKECTSCVAQLEDVHNANRNLKTSLRDLENSLKLSEELIKNLNLERNNIQKGKNETEEKLVVLTERNQELSADNERLLSVYQEEVNKSAFWLLEKSQLLEECNRHVAQLNDFQRKTEDLKTSLEDTDKRLKQSEEVIKNLTLERNNIQKDKNDVEEELKASTERNEELSADNERIMSIYQEQENKCSSLLLENTKLSEECNKHIIQLDDIQRKTENLATLLKDTDTSYNKLKSEYDSCVVQLKDIQRDNKHLKTRLEESSIGSMQLTESIKKLTSEKSEIIEDRNKVYDELKITTEKLNQLSVDNSELQTNYQDEVKKYESLVHENKQTLEECSRHVMSQKDMQEKIENLQISLHNIDQSYRQLKENYDKLAYESDCILEDKNKLTGELKMANEKLQELSRDNEKLLSECQGGVKKYESLLQEKTQLSDEHNRCIVKLQDMQEEKENLNARLKDINDDIKQLNENNEKLANERERILEDLNKLDKEFRMTNDNSEKLSSDNQKLLTEYQNQLIKYESVVQEKKQLSEECDSIKKNMEKLKTSLDNMKGSRNSILEENHKLIEELRDITDKQKFLGKENDSLLVRYEELYKLYSDENIKTQAQTDFQKLFELEKSELTEKLENAYEENRKVSEQLDKFSKENHEILNLLNEVNSEKCILMHKLEVTEHELESVLEDRTHIIERKNAIEQDYESVKLAFERVESEKNCSIDEMKKLQDKFENFIAENAEACEKLDEYIKERHELSNSLSECLLTKENLTEELNTVTQEKQVLSSFLNELKSENLTLSKELDETKLELEKFKLRIKSLTEERENLDREKLCIQQELSKTISEKENLTSENSKVSEDLKKISNELKSLESEKNYLYTKLELVVKENDGINENSDKKIKDLEHSKTKLLDELDQVSLENEYLKTNLNSLESKVAKLESENNELYEDKSKISKELENLSTKFEDLIKDKGLVNKELSILFSQLENIMTEKNKLSADLVQTKNENSSYVEQIAGLSRKYQDTQLDNEKLRNELDVSIVEIKETTRLLEVTTEKVEVLQLQNTQTTEQLNCILNIMKSSSEKLHEIFVNLQIYENANGNEIRNRTEKDADQPVEINKICENFKIQFEEIENLPAKLMERNKIVSKDLQFYCEENQNLKSELDGKNKEIDNITCEINEIQKNTEKVKKENHELSQEIVSLKLDVEKLTTDYQEVSENLTKVIEEKNLISNFLDLNSNELQKVIQEKEEILGALEMSNKDVENISEQKIDIETKNSELVLLINEQSSELKTVSEKNSGLLKEIVDLRKTVEDVSKELDAVASENYKLLEQLENVSKVKADFSEELDKVSQEKADLSDKLQNLMKKHFESSEYIKDLLVKIEHLTEENTQLIGKITTVSNDLEEKSKNFQLLELSCKQLKKLADEKSEILEKVSEENKGIFDIVDRLSQEKLEMSDTINQLSEEKMNTIETINKLTTELKILSEDKLKLSESLEMGHKELQKVKRERNEILESQTAIMKETESTILLAHQSAVEVKQDLLKRIETAEKDKEKQRNQFDAELKKVREAYVNVVTMNSKLELENVNLRKKIEERNSQLNEFAQVKEAYEKLLEENNKLMTEVDTVKYKRARDREELVSLLKKEREEADVRESKRIREVRNEYEGKVEKMKDKMLKMYREEVNKEIKKVKVGQSETDGLQEIVKDLRSELFEAEQKIHLLETERDMLRIKESTSQRNLYTSRESLRSLKENGNPRESVRSSLTSLRSTDIRSRPNSEQMVRKVKSVSTIQPSHRERGNVMSDRRTQPQFTEIEETVTFSRRTSINGVPTNITPSMEMEDEDDDFNNKFLADMKAGKCIVAMANNDGTGRLSELAWRNSLVPPHLKSCYPAETQFVSPTHFKEDDLKSGNVELDDSLCKLLPGEKPRQKKDFGTTAYKKPGPPTPSKNGGRLSLQGNEVLPLREHNDRSPKKSITPSRIKALFMGRTKENSENQFTPKTNNKRMSIFRKQK